MGLFSQIFGRNRPDGLFRSEMQHLSNKVNHVAKNQEKFDGLRQMGIDMNLDQELRVYFITDTKDKAQALLSTLASMDYHCDVEAPTEGDRDYLVSGNTSLMNTSEESLAEWTDLMCDLAASHDCEFLDWTTAHASEQQG